MRESNFTNSQKAEIFVLDRATCAYTGYSLWMLDYGLDPLYKIDWIDHLEPSSKGGASVIENGVAACSIVNKLRNNTKQWPILYYRGYPTPHHAQLVGYLDPVIERNLIRFKNLHESDWYLNRTIFHVVAAIQSEHDCLNHGKKYSRGYQYYANAAIKMLDTWRTLVEKSAVPSIEKRKLIDGKLEFDQETLLSVRDVGSAAEIVALMKELYPIFEEAFSSWFILSQAGGDVELLDLYIKSFKKGNVLPQRMVDKSIQYAKSLKRVM